MNDELKALLGQVLTKLESLDNKVSAVQEGQAKLEAGQDELRTGQAKLEAGQTQIREVLGANHFQLRGRIDQLSDQLQRHLIEDHGPAPADADRKRA